MGGTSITRFPGETDTARMFKVHRKVISWTGIKPEIQLGLNQSKIYIKHITLLGSKCLCPSESVLCVFDGRLEPQLSCCGVDFSCLFVCLM